MTNQIDFNDFLSGLSGKQKENAEKILGKAFEKENDDGSQNWLQQKYPGLFPNWSKK